MEHLLTPYTAVTHIGRGAALVLAAHPDDEVLGCAGAILRHVQTGDPLHVVIVTNGGHREDAGSDQNTYIAQRRQESRDAAALLGYGFPIFWDLPDRKLEYGELLVSRLVTTVCSIQADLVYAPSPFELHPDHRTLGMAAAEAIRRCGRVCRLMFYEISAPLRPNILLDISDLIERKRAAIACFVTQLQRQRYDDHVLALNRFRTYTLPKEIIAAEAYLTVTAEDLQRDPLEIYVSEFERHRRLGLSFEPADALPLVTVIIRSIGRDTLLRAALDSVALQTYPNIEVLVVNAKGPAHPDLDEWCGRFPLRLVSRDHPLGRSAAANAGLDEAKGDYLIFLDDDDCFCPNHVSSLVQMLQKHPDARVAYAGVEVMTDPTEDSPPRPGVFNDSYDPVRLRAGNYIPINAVVFDRDLLRFGCRFDEGLEVYEDWDFWLQLSRFTRFVHCNQISARYRPSGLSGVGLQPDPRRKLDGRVQLLDKWRLRWSGSDIHDLLALLDQTVAESVARSVALEHQLLETDEERRRAADREAAAAARTAALEHQLRATDEERRRAADREAAAAARTAALEHQLRETDEERRRAADREAAAAALFDQERLQLRAETEARELTTHALVEQLQREIATRDASLRLIYESHGWRALQMYYHARDQILPLTTKRRHVANAVWRFARKVLRPIHISPGSPGRSTAAGPVWYRLAKTVYRYLPLPESIRPALKDWANVHLIGRNDGQPDRSTSFGGIVTERFKALQPLRVYFSRASVSRINLVTDSVNAGSLFGGVATSIILSALLAEKKDAVLRVITRTEKADEWNVAHILKSNDIEWNRNIHFVHADIRKDRGAVDVGDRDLFVTTSWWTTTSVIARIAEERVLYLLQEDERTFYPYGDDHLRCTELLKNSRLRFIINSHLLHNHLVESGFDNMKEHGFSFEPSFPSRMFFREARRSDDKKNFFFYARPNNLRNLFYRGLEVLEGAVLLGILNPSDWDFYFVGKDIPNLSLMSDCTPRRISNVGWEEYGALVRKMDLGLCLMYSPHPSYPPLDLAASGAVVVTNRFGRKADLEGYSRNILCRDLDTDTLIDGIADAVTLVADKTRRDENYRTANILRSWRASFQPILERLG